MLQLVALVVLLVLRFNRCSNVQASYLHNPAHCSAPLQQWLPINFNDTREVLLSPRSSALEVLLELHGTRLIKISPAEHPGFATFG